MSSPGASGIRARGPASKKWCVSETVGGDPCDGKAFGKREENQCIYGIYGIHMVSMVHMVYMVNGWLMDGMYIYGIYVL